ncbi:MAG: GIY-YIG nuclease family protein [Candidatus Wolfebacteria bacterium]|nr:GIY-YIG nuclease family protein [Candidatus Wolfebacteria bacterium]
MDPVTTTSMMRLYYVYVLESIKDGKRYVGFTNDLKKRLSAHQKGEVSSTAHRKPFRLIYFEGCTNIMDTKRREHYLKTTGGRRFLVKRLQEYYRN